MSATSGAGMRYLALPAGRPEAEQRHAHLAGIGDRVYARAVLVDPDGRYLDDVLTDLPRSQEQLDVEEQVHRGDPRQDLLGGIAPKHLRAALRVAIRQAEQAPHSEREAGACGTTHTRTRARQHRGRMVAAGDRAAGAAGDVCKPQHLRRRRGAIGVDEAEHVRVRTAERRGYHAALAELGVTVQTNAAVLVAMLADDLGGAVRAAVERDVEAHVASATNGSVGTERSVDPVFLVVRGDHDVETQKDLPMGPEL